VRVFYTRYVRESVATDEAIYDAMSGEALQFEYVTVATAEDPLMAYADAGGVYIKVHLAAGGSEEGQARLIILQTYQMRRVTTGTEIQSSLIFRWDQRNSVVLPAGYEFVAV